MRLWLKISGGPFYQIQTAERHRAEQIFVETKGKEGRLFNFVEDHRKSQGIL